ncbi:sporulation integral membrane protein YtvI [Sutcliffiella deserti]|uniref:sporulation integral membrane protein YtvI n=1 Tax=Sutcliffiella deserti TaxID=2875501 RepID=UPI001CC0272B|nr:sporulation integral membrane protein YtvI [Sutcliffiella deserti]
MSTLFTKKFLFILIIITLICIIGYFILPVSIPIIVALITAFMLEPLVRLFQVRANFKRSLSVFIVFLLFVTSIGIVGYFITTKVITEAINVIENAPSYINEINRVWRDIQLNLTNASEDLPPEVVEEISNQIEQFLYDLRIFLTDLFNIQNVKNLFTDIPNYLVSFIVYLIALFLFLIDMPRLKLGVYSHLKESTADKVKFMTSRLSYVVFGFFKAQFLVSIVIFVVSFIGLLIIAPEKALIMAFVIWIIDFIPIIGSIVILGPWAIFHLITGGIGIGTQLAVLAIVLLIIRRTVEPKVMGTHIGLSPLATLIAMYLGLKLLGILGFIVGPLILIAFNSAREAGIIKTNFKI